MLAIYSNFFNVGFHTIYIENSPMSVEMPTAFHIVAVDHRDIQSQLALSDNSVRGVNNQ
ncbi:hypothetical protein PhaeoP54_00169 [Phaeobacter inhibens]|nr:hypothetical protein PhaeoP54_00169 [Phaeobacter inhibens]